MRYAMLVIAAFLAGTAVAADHQVGERLAPDKTRPPPQHFQEVSWDDLLSEGWDPMKAIEDLNLDALSDEDPRAEAAAEKMRAMWSAAPSNPAINGRAIRIAGFVVPLEYGKQEITEFLLVPYFGACIHVPPPPANQIIHVIATRPYKTETYMDAVWVEGIIELAETETDMGDSGYRLKAQTVVPFEEPD